MSMHRPFKSLPMEDANVVLFPHASLQCAEHLEPVFSENTAPLAVKVFLDNSPASDDDATTDDIPVLSVPITARSTSLGVPLKAYRSYGSSDTSSEEESEGPDTPSTSLEAGEDDWMSRAMSFAKMRGPNSGMHLRMAQFLNAMECDSDEDDQNLPKLAQEVIKSVSNSPVDLDRHVSPTSVSHDTPAIDELDSQQAERHMMLAYVAQWGSNVRLDTTYWQGFSPRHLAIEIPLREKFTVFLAEKAIQYVSGQLGLPAPLETTHDRPRLETDPVFVGLGLCRESGSLLTLRLEWEGSSPETVQETSLNVVEESAQETVIETSSKTVQKVSPETVLKNARVELKAKGKDVTPGPVRLQAGAKLATGRQKPEAKARREYWRSSPSKHKYDITASIISFVEA